MAGEGKRFHKGPHVGPAFTSAKRESACTLYTEGAEADTIAEAAAAASAAEREASV